MIESSKRIGETRDAGWRQKASMIAPLLIFFVVGASIDTSPIHDGQTINAPVYFASVTIRVALMSAVIGWFAGEILAQFPLSSDRWGWLVGVFGAVIWIGVCGLDLERSLIRAAGFSDDWLPQREGVNPFETYTSGIELNAFLLFRFTLLALCVPIAEELFLRGFVMRAFEVEDWTKLPLERIGRNGLVIGTVYGVVTHPSECIAAAIWFTLVTLLMVKTGRFWNCVLAHAVTNLILGVYVCVSGHWELW
ncbi:MAG: CPBP family intramembrane metalloprotease [Planctomycetales bacterium]|nr:CPBP family intramembrane metalloprotease [Planctomycetales bacterium]